MEVVCFRADITSSGVRLASLCPTITPPFLIEVHMATLLTAVPTSTTIIIAAGSPNTLITANVITAVGPPVATCTPTCLELDSGGRCVQYQGCECIVAIGVQGHPDCTFRPVSRSGAGSSDVLRRGGKGLMFALLGLGAIWILGR